MSLLVVYDKISYNETNCILLFLGFALHMMSVTIHLIAVGIMNSFAFTLETVNVQREI